MEADSKVCVDNINHVVGYFLKHGSYEIRRQLFPTAHSTYWEQGANLSLEAFYTGLDDVHRTKFVQLVKLECDAL